MLLHSWPFLFGFMPVILVLLVGTITTIRHIFVPLTILIAGSLVFAGMQSVGDVVLILSSAIFNYLLAAWIRTRPATDSLRRWGLYVGIAANIALLTYFKYVDFLLDSVNGIVGGSYHIDPPAFLPIGLSFLTFQQVAFLVDGYRGQLRREDVSFPRYLLFCSFFSKQLAGPIVRHDEFFPQINALVKGINPAALAEGLTRFTVGFFEKVVLADNLAQFAAPAFDAASAGKPLGFVAAWGGVLAFTFQLYFDFAGYSNMAIGVARMVGFSLPENFMSPYKAISIVDFWRRWHMTLSRFLRDYLYIPLGGNRKGFARQLINMMVTMVLGGLWHGANWTFVMWGALHGVYLGINHSWRNRGWACSDRLGWILTFAGVVYAWVWFRADTAAAAVRLTRALVGLDGLWAEGFRQAARAVQEPLHGGLWSLAVAAGLQDRSLSYGRWAIAPANTLLSGPSLHLMFLILSGAIVWQLPTVQEWLQHRRQHSAKVWSASTGMLVASILLFALFVSMHGTARTFVYSQF